MRVAVIYGVKARHQAFLSFLFLAPEVSIDECIKQIRASGKDVEGAFACGTIRVGA